MKKWFKVIKNYLKKLKFVSRQIYIANPMATVFIIFILLLRGISPVLQKYFEKNIISLIEISLKNINYKFVYDLLWFIVVYIICSILPFWLLSFQRAYERSISLKVAYQIQNLIVEKTRKIPFKLFHDAHFQDLYREANQHGSNEAFNIVVAYCFAFFEIITFLGYTFSLFKFSSWLFACLAVLNIPIVACKFKLQKQRFILERSQMSGRREMSYCSEVLTDKDSLNDTKIYNMHEYFMPRKRSILNMHIKEIEAYNKKELLLFLISFVLSAIGLFIVQKESLSAFLRGIIGMPMFIFLISVSISWQSKLFGLIDTLTASYNSLLYIDFLLDFLKLPIQDNVKCGPLICEKQYELELKNICFSYPLKDVPCLTNINLKLTPGSSYCLIGENGAGKTTLLSLLMRIYEPTSGQILLNGVDIRNYKLEEYYKLIGYLPQYFCRYSMPVKNYLNLDNSHSFSNKFKIFDSLIAKLSSGAKSILTQRFNSEGEELSGGQWQQLSFFRALFKNAYILICDEPTAFVDLSAEQSIYGILNEYGKQHISLYTTHVASVWEKASKLIFMGNGKIINMGSHQELILNCKQYADLYAKAQNSD